MSQDLGAILTGAPAKSSGSATQTFDPIDAAIRTVYGEAPPDATPEERQAIAAVIVNRARKSGKTLDQVVQEPGQFEPWHDSKARKRITSLSPNDPAYQSIAGDVGDILSGKSNPHPDLTNFYAPDAQAALGREKPAFDNGSGKQIGKHLFFADGGAPGAVGGSPQDLGSILTSSAAPAPTSDNPGQPAPDDDAAKAFAEQFGDPAKYDDKGAPRLVSYAGIKAAPYPEQQAAWKALKQGGGLDESAPEGSAMNPWWLHPGATLKDAPPGSYVMDEKGRMVHIAKPGEPQDSSFLHGMGQGVGDVVQSAAELLPGTEDSDIRNALKAHQLRYNADYGGDLKSGLGRFTGQVVGSAPLVAGSEELVAPALVKLLGPAGEFLAGRAGGNLLVRGGSKAALGAQVGAEGAALTSAADERPLGEQMAEGAAGGAILGPLVPAAIGAGRWAGRTARSMTEPLTEGGRDTIVNRVIQNFGEGGNMKPDASEIIPGSLPTLATATANPGIASLERTVRLARPTPFAERTAQNADARSRVLEGLRGDEQTVADLARNRQDVVAAARENAFKSTKPADAASVVSAIDSALESPAGHMDEVARPLQVLRDKIVTPPAETTPEEIAAFNRKVANTFGADADALTPEVMDAAKSKIGETLNGLAGKTGVAWDDALRTDLGEIIHQASQVLPDDQVGPLTKQLDAIASVAHDGKSISGESYQALTRKGSPLDRLQNSGDSNIRYYASQIRNALDDALERNIAPEDKAALQGARLQYKNLKTVEAALRTAGPDSRVTPQAVMSAVKRNFGQFTYKGGGSLGDTAQEALAAEHAKGPTVETDPRQLFGMRENLSSAIDKLERDGSDSSLHAAEQLKAVREQLDASIDKSAEGYKAYLDISKTSSEPIEAQKFLQTLRLTDAKGTVQLGRVDSALKRIADMRAKPGDNPAKKITDETLVQLEKLHADLLRESNINLGRPLGSDTAQHIVTGNIADSMNAPLAVGAGALMHHPLVGAAVGAGKLFYGAKSQQVLDQLATRLLEPSEIAEQARRIPMPKKPGAIDRMRAAAIAQSGGVLANSLTGQK